MNYLFYDLETSGLCKSFDQIFRYASITTDQDLNEIDRCVESNLNGHMSINSFSNNMLMNLKQSAMNAEDEKSLEEIRSTLYQVTDCKQDNSYYLP